MSSNISLIFTRSDKKSFYDKGRFEVALINHSSTSYENVWFLCGFVEAEYEHLGTLEPYSCLFFESFPMKKVRSPRIHIIHAPYIFDLYEVGNPLSTTSLIALDIPQTMFLRKNAQYIPLLQKIGWIIPLLEIRNRDDVYEVQTPFGTLLPPTKGPIKTVYLTYESRDEEGEFYMYHREIHNEILLAQKNKPRGWQAVMAFLGKLVGK